MDVRVLVDLRIRVDEGIGGKGEGLAGPQLENVHD